MRDGGSLTLGSVPPGAIIASAAAGGGAQLTLHNPENDFNHDGRSDVLLRNDNGTVTEWLAQSGGSFAWNAIAT